MSQVGEQLVVNEQARRAARQTAQQLVGELIVATSVADDQGLAELDFDRIMRLVIELQKAKTQMRRLRSRYGQLSAQAAGDDG